jgi:hypothetical protein
MILLVIRRKGSDHTIVFRLKNDEDYRQVEEITNHLKLYLENVEFSYVPTEGSLPR